MAKSGAPDWLVKRALPLPQKKVTSQTSAAPAKERGLILDGITIAAAGISVAGITIYDKLHKKGHRSEA